jgi:hypothetical protein
MKFKTITVEAKRSDGNYGSDAVRFEVEVGDGESPTEVTNTLKMYADWHLNGERYSKQSEEHYAKGNRKWTEAYEGWLHRVTEAVNKIEKPKSE